MSDKPHQIQLSGRQQELYKALSEKEQSLADIYLGSLMILQQTENPDSLALAAHGLRELMEKLPRYLDTPIEDKKGPTLKEKARELEQAWDQTLENSGSYSNSDWSGNIDRLLRTFLRKASDFFTWFKAERPTKKQQTEKILRELDPLGQSLPNPIETLRIEEWDQYNNFFQKISHHNAQSTPEVFSSFLYAFENFLLDRLLPRTFEDHTELDSIIREGETGANH